jgi:ankyrin repeat protein
LSASPLIDLIEARIKNPNADSSAAMKWANEHGFGQIVKDLLAYQIDNPVECSSLDFVIVQSCLLGHSALVKLLLADKRIDPSVQNQSTLGWACESGHLEVVELLLADKRVDPSFDNNYPFRIASFNGHLEVVKLLLADKRVDPSAKGQAAICFACQHAHTEVVKLLLIDKRVDPSADNNYPVRIASFNGDLEIVQLLLADKRVDPSADKQFALRFACQNNCSGVVKLLLTDERVDPSFDANPAIRQAIANECVSTAKASLSDIPVSPSFFSTFAWYPPSPELLALLFLRRLFRLEFLLLLQKQPDLHQVDCRSFIADIEKLDSQRKAWLDAHLLVSDLSALCLEYVPDLFCHLDTPVSSLIDPNYDAKFPLFSFSNLSSL